MPAPYQNVHGRRATRGLRPWLLLPKVLAVGVYLGGLVAALVLWQVQGILRLPMQGGGPDLVLPVPLILHGVEFLFLRICLPALGAATFFGVLLLAQHPGVFIRQRWLQVKLVLLVLGVPTGEAIVIVGINHLRTTNNIISANRMLNGGLGLLIALAVALIVLGRMKPRLGQGERGSAGRRADDAGGAALPNAPGSPGSPGARPPGGSPVPRRPGAPGANGESGDGEPGDTEAEEPFTL